MSALHLTASMLARSVHVIDSSGVLDLVCPERESGSGRIGNLRANTRLYLIGLRLATQLGRETTVRGVYDVLTQSVARDAKWDLGVLRPVTTKASRNDSSFDPDQPRLTSNGKPRKRIWGEDGVEEIGYDDLHRASSSLRQRLEFGRGSAPDLDEATRAARTLLMAAVVDALLTQTTLPRTGKTFAIDATGQWVWSRGSKKGRNKLEASLKAKKAKQGNDSDSEASIGTEPEPLATDDAGDTSPDDHPDEAPVGARGRCLDAAWGYKTSKHGDVEVGFGFHAHVIVRVPENGQDSEPVLIDGVALTPANSSVPGVSLDLVDRIRSRHDFRRIIGDQLYTNLKADKWAQPLADRGIEQALYVSPHMHAAVVSVHGAPMQFGWLHCPAADMSQRPIPPKQASEEEWEQHIELAEDFQRNWSFDRKESGLGRNRTTKWICPAVAGRVGCPARGPANITGATRRNLPIVTPPEDWQDRKCCTNRSLDFTPDPANHHHQRKLMQREYVGSRRWRQVMKLRSYVEGTFGILKNASRQRLRRGQNRLPGLAMATLITAIKASVYNEEQLRAWHERTGLGPADHPLLQPDPPHWGHKDLTKEEAKAIDAHRLAEVRQSSTDTAA